MANDLQAKNVNIYIDDAPARDAYERLSKKADVYNKTLDAGAKKAEHLSKAIAKSLAAGGKPTRLQAELVKVNKELDKNGKELSKVTAQQKQLQQQIDSKSGPSLRQQQALVNKLSNEFKLLGSNTQEASNKLNELTKASASLNVMKDRLNAVTKAQKDSGTSSSFLGSFFGNVAANVVAKAGALVSDFFQGTIDEALEAEEATARFKSTLDNLGRLDAFDRIMAKADQMAEKFKYLDNDEVVGVFNKLIDYGKLTEQQMNDLLPVIIDFAAKQRISVEESSSVIIKSLEGNGKALKEYGINIGDAGTETERLNVIMTTLKDKVEGAGLAFQDTAAGGIAAAKQELANVKEEIGVGLLPVLNKALGLFNKLLIGLKEISSRASTAVGDIKTFFTDGDVGLAIRRAQREAEKQKKAEAGAVSNYLSGFQDKSPEDIANEVVEIQKRINAKQRTINSAGSGIRNGTFSEEELRKATQGLRILKEEYSGLLKLQDSKSNQEILGSGGFGGDEEGDKNKKSDEAGRLAKAAADKAAAERKRIADAIKKDQEDLDKFLKQQAFESSLFDETEKEKELNRLAQTYEDKKSQAHGNKEQLLFLEKVYAQKVLEVYLKYGRENLKAELKLQADREAEREKFFARVAQSGIEQLQKVRSSIDGALGQANDEELARLELKILKSSGKEKLNAQKEQLDKEESQAIQAVLKKLTEEERVAVTQHGKINNEIALIEEQYRLKKRETDVAFYAGVANEILTYATQVLSIFEQFGSAQNNKEQAELSKLQKKNEKEKTAYQKLLNNKLISRQAYDQKIAGLDAEVDKKKEEIEKKQFDRNKKIQIAQAIANGAMGITSVLAARPGASDVLSLGAFRAINIALTVAATAASIASISKTKYAKGGLLNGPGHNQGGMPVINPRTGRKEAEVEGGEVILSRRTVRNNAAIVGQLLDSSMNRNGATLQPGYKTRAYRGIDYTGLSRTIQKVRHFEKGGVFSQPTASTAGEVAAPQVLLPPGFELMPELFKALAARLDVAPKAYVVYSEIEQAGSKIDQIKSDATFVKQ